MCQRGEIITFQIGNYANMVGGHYFNLQDPILNPEYEKDFSWNVLWREGRNRQGQHVWTPRVMMFDVKDNWTNKFIGASNGHGQSLSTQAGAPPMENTFDKIEKGISWDGKVQRVMVPGNESDSDEDPSPTDAKNKSGPTAYKNWGHYVQWKLHELDKFAFRVPNYLYNAESDELVSYGQGLEIYRKMNDNIMEGIRLYAEECDFLEGFHMLVDEFNGFTGLASGILEYLGDEYDKKACLGLGLNKPLPETPNEPSLKDYKIRISNTLQLWASFNRHARVFSSVGVTQDIFQIDPIARKFPGVVQDLSSPYVSSAILASALDSLSAPYRMQAPTFPLHEMTSLLNAFGHKMTLFGTSLPYPYSHETLFSALNNHGLSCLTSLTPSVDIDLTKSLGNLFVLRGLNQEKFMSNLESREYKFAGIKDVTGCIELYCHETYPKSLHVIKNVSAPFKSRHPFPVIYEPDYLDTHAVEKGHSARSGDNWSLAGISSAHNSPAIGELLEKVTTVVGGGSGGSMMKMKSFYLPTSETCNSATVELDDYAECITDLCSLRETYL